MATRETISTIRFGYGLGPNVTRRRASDHLQGLATPDQMVRAFPTTDLSDGLDMIREFRVHAKSQNEGKEGAREKYKASHAKLRKAYRGSLRTGFARIVATDTPFRERLAWFWSDHFTASPKRAPMRGIAPSYLDDAIRPHLTGRFGDMLNAVVTHPFMLTYLDQNVSMGPNSKTGQRRGKGLNENLAREVLELHTLGVGGVYGQNDVHKLAELMTGLSVDLNKGFVFRAALAEPGNEKVLGKSYGGNGQAKLADITQAMDDIAVHPDTARHIARKLAVHFVSDDPDPTLLLDLEKTFTATDGDLMALYETLLTHPTAESPLGGKVKQPFDFLASSLVAMGFRPGQIDAMSTKDFNRFLFFPMAAMGQPYLSPPGPDGWSESAADWITPQGLATRISWSMKVAEKLQSHIGDPREFLETALGDSAQPTTRFAVSAAETKAVGIGLVLASAEFNRR